jgi:type IV pilus assembly protein PilX
MVSLIMLLAMTLIGVTSMQGTSMQEKMAGNVQDINRSFQAAEAALREGEAVLTAATLPDFDGTGGLYQSALAGNTRVWEISGNWTTSNSKVYSSTLDGVAKPPQYMIEELPATIDIDSGGFAADEPLAEIGMYRVTAIGWGGSETTVSMIQSTYKR